MYRLSINQKMQIHSQKKWILHQLCRQKSLNEKKNLRCPDDQLRHRTSWYVVITTLIYFVNIYTEMKTFKNIYFARSSLTNRSFEIPAMIIDLSVFVLHRYLPILPLFSSLIIIMYCLKLLYFHFLSCSHDAYSSLFLFT